MLSKHLLHSLNHTRKRLDVKQQASAGDYIFPPQPQPSLPIQGSARLLPVHRIYCVGRNYAEHAIEMGHDPKREPPFFFQKNPDTLVPDGGRFPYPGRSNDVHHEFELVVALGQGGKDIKTGDALDHIFGYAVGLDMTRRDLQGEVKKLGRPWEVGKAFEHAAPCSAVHPAAEIGHPAKGAIWLDVNGERRQSGDLAQLIWSIPEVITHLSALFELKPGDLIFTGTPAGVGPVKRGDRLHGAVEGVGELRIEVV
ncbi:fumarylacetoacetate hydrolase family protein [Hypericibacter adhaerens]|nr:fumarylacetoacetate hydrolase family protein [Hypericibacter adhaerens]